MLVELGLKNDAKLPLANRISNALWHALTKPVVIAPALGIAYSIAEFHFPGVVDGCFTLIGTAAPGVALFLTGLILSSQLFRVNWEIIGATAAADVIRPLLAAAAFLALPVPNDTARIAILISTIPSGFFGILFAVSYRLDPARTGSMVIASTVVSVVTMAIAIAVLFP